MIRDIFAFPERAYWLVAALLVAFLIFAVSKKRKALLQKWNLIRSDAPAFTRPANRVLKTALYLAGFVLLALAFMGPQWGQKEHALKTEGLDMCIALDLSRSMLAEDMSPSRLDQAKNQLTAFLPKLGGDRVTLVAFAGSAYMASPLTSDYSALINYLAPLDPSFITNQATSLDSAILNCLRGLKVNDAATAESLEWESAKLIALVTDGESTGDEGSPAVDRLKKLGIPVFAIALGTREGAKIPIRDERGQLRSYLPDPTTGKPAVTKLEDESLKKIAMATEGQVFYGENGLSAWQDFYAATKKFKRSAQDAGSRFSKEHRFQFPLGIAFLFLLWDLLLTETRVPWAKLRFWRRRSP